jgi:hypothetical protein
VGFGVPVHTSFKAFCLACTHIHLIQVDQPFRRRRFLSRTRPSDFNFPRFPMRILLVRSRPIKCSVCPSFSAPHSQRTNSAPLPKRTIQIVLAQGTHQQQSSTIPHAPPSHHLPSRPALPQNLNTAHLPKLSTFHSLQSRLTTSHPPHPSPPRAPRAPRKATRQEQSPGLFFHLPRLVPTSRQPRKGYRKRENVRMVGGVSSTRCRIARPSESIHGGNRPPGRFAR